MSTNGISVGDAVLTFTGDMTQLDLAFDKVNQAADSKLTPAANAADKVGNSLDGAGKKGATAGQTINEAWLKVAQATKENQEAQKQLQTALKAVQKAGSDNQAAMTQLALAQQKASKAALELSLATKEANEADQEHISTLREKREALEAQAELTGIALPRALQSWIAELPGVGMALETAFSGLAVLLLIDILGEGVNKLMEWKEASEKLREDWTASDTQFRTTSDNIQQEIDAQSEKFISLTKGPIAAYDFALKHLKSTFDGTLGLIGQELDNQAGKFSDRGGFFKSIFGGEDSANADKVGKDLKEFSALMQETMKTAQSADKNNPFAGMDAGLDKLKDKLKEVDKQIADENDRIKEANDNPESASVFGVDVNSLERMRTVLQMMEQLLQQSRNREDQNRKTQEAEINSEKIAAQNSLDTARLEADKAYSLSSLAIEAERNQVSFDRGKESLDQYLANLKTEKNQEYQVERKALEDRLALLQKDPTRNAEAIIQVNGEIKNLSMQHSLDMMKLDEQAYQAHAGQTVKALELTIASTKQGSQDRINAEKALLEFLKQTYGEESDAYLQQKQKVAQAERVYAQTQRQLAEEGTQFAEKQVTQRTQSEVAYYNYLRSIAAISQAQLIHMQQQASEEVYKAKKKALEQELAQLGPEEVVAKKKVLDEIQLLDEQYEADRRLLYLQTNQILETSYQQLGQKSTMQLMRNFEQTKEAYNEIAKSGTATYQQLLEGQMKVLQAQIQLNAAMGKDVTKDQTALDKLTKTYHQWALAMGQINTLGKTQEAVLKGLGVDLNLMGSTAQNVALGATAALSKMFEAWQAGGVTVAQACEQITASILQSLSQYAFAKAVEQLALGFAAMSPVSPDFGHSGEHFASAALWFAAGAATSVVGGIISNASSGSASAGPSSAGSSSAAINSPSAPNPVQTVNVQHFAEGGLVSSPTLAVIGDSVGGSGGSREAAIPLDHPDALRAIGEALGPYVASGGGNINVYVKGLISPDNLTKVTKQISTKVKKNQATLYSSNSLRITKRSV